MAGILDLMGYIQDQSEKGRQAGLSRLVGKAYGAAPDQQQQILSTVAQRGAPDMAMNADKAFGEQQDNVHLQMAKRAAEVVALYQSNPQMAQQVYQNGLLPIARRAGVPNAPMQLDASLIPGLEKLASAANASGTPAELQTFNALTAGMPPEDIASARRVKLGLDPRAPVTQPFIFDPTRGVWVSNPGYRGDAPQAQQQPQQAPQNMPPQRMSDDQIVAMANQMTQQGVPADQVDQWVRQQQSMTQYEPAPAQAPMPQAPASQAVPVAGLPDKPQAPPTQLQLNADQRDQARLELAQQQARQAAQAKKATATGGAEAQKQAVYAKNMAEDAYAFAAAFTGIPAAQLKAMSPEQVRQAMLQHDRTTAGPVLGSIPGMGKFANADLEAYSNSAAGKQARINNPTGPVTNADFEVARKSVFSADKPRKVNADLVYEALVRAQQAPAAQAAPQSGSDFSHLWGGQ